MATATAMYSTLLSLLPHPYSHYFSHFPPPFSPSSANLILIFPFSLKPQIESACFPVRAQCCSWCCREDIEGYANICRTSGLEDPNCPGEGPDARPVDGSLTEPVVANVEGSGVDEEGGGS